MPKITFNDILPQLGRLLVMGFEGTEMSASLNRMLAKVRPGGVILFRRNIEGAAQTHALLRDVQKVVRFPLLRCVDMEGGTVDRFRDAVARIPSAGEVAETGSTALFHKHGLLIGRQLRALGFNTDFAPCLDLGLEASRKTLGTRTVSADPRQTVRYARAFLGGLHEAKILGCGKHFPGLGGAALDSHHALPVVDRTWKQVWEKDLLPYHVMKKELPFVMVAHVSYPRIVRSGGPASLSKRWIEGVLRAKIGYSGLVLSDDLDMGGVLKGASIEDAAIGTIEAGADMMLVCQKEEHVWRAYEAVVSRSQRDVKFARLLWDRWWRISEFLASAPELQARMAPAPTTKTVDMLRRRVWEFTEELRMSAIIPPEERAL
jgi:beta-N-acetylhexosaminidase